MAKILLVEDERNIASFIERGLHEFGHTVSVTHDGTTAWELLQHEAFDLLVLDIITNFAGADGVKANGDRAYSSYFSIAAPFKLGGLDWSAEIGATPWETSFYNNGASGFEVSNICLGASKEIKITDSYSLPVFAQAIWNPATEGAYFVFGISF